jgi:hypothetical protein
MAFFTVLMIVIVVLAIIGIGWSTFSVGVINGFERVIDMGRSFVNDLTQEGKHFLNTRLILAT